MEQLLNYLKATGYKIGLLVNFTHPKAIIRRFVL
ncbi:MAG: GxxExxY protein [Desulfobacterales bacterium]